VCVCVCVMSGLFFIYLSFVESENELLVTRTWACSGFTVSSFRSCTLSLIHVCGSIITLTHIG
jgi:hypothetical protein